VLAVAVVGVVRPADTVAAGDAQAAVAIVPVSGSLAPLEVSSTSIADSRPSPDTTMVPTLSRPVRVLVLGDSTAQRTAIGLTGWAFDHPTSMQVTDASVPGCGFLRDGVVPTDGDFDWVGPCRRVLDDDLPVMLRDLQPDVVMLMVTMRDVEDRSWGDEGVISPFDPRFRERLATQYADMADRLMSAGVPHVAWILPPHPVSPFQGEQRKMLVPARYEVQFDVIRQLASAHPDTIAAVDMSAWLAAAGDSEPAGARPDGLHWSEEASRWLSDTYLAPLVVSLAAS
jgi:hypothetical protein